MWNHTFVLAGKIKMTVLAWTAGLVIISTISDQFDKPIASAAPLAIMSVLAQTFVAVAALKIGVDAVGQQTIRPNVLRVLGISIVTTIAIVMAGVFLIIPGVFLLIRWWIAAPLALDRDIGVIEACRESWSLTAGHWAEILSLLLGFVALYVAGIAVLYFAGTFESDTISVPISLLSNTLVLITTTLGAVSTVAAYREIDQPVAGLRQVFE